MDNTRFVCRFQPFRNLAADVERFFHGNRPRLGHLRQRLPVHQLQDEEVDTIGIVEAVDRGDVGMVQRGEELGFSLEPGQALLVGGKFFGEDLDGHGAG